MKCYIKRFKFWLTFSVTFPTTFIADIKRFEHKNTIRGLARTGRGAGGKLARNNAKEVTTISRAKGTTSTQCLFVQLNNGLISGRAQSREVFVQYSIIRLPLNKTIPQGRVPLWSWWRFSIMCYDRILSYVSSQGLLGSLQLFGVSNPIVKYCLSEGISDKKTSLFVWRESSLI